MSYIRFVMMSAFIFLTTSLCFAGGRGLEIEEIGFPVREIGVGPGHPSTTNQLIFTFDASQQTLVQGTFKGLVTFPDGTQYSVTGIIGNAGNPVSIEVGPPSISGNYVMTFQITSLTSGSIKATQGPFGLAQALNKSGTTISQLSYTFKVSHINDQDSVNFLNPS